MKLSNESFHRWKHDPITIAVIQYIQQSIAEVDRRLANGYWLLDLPAEEMAKKLAKLVGQKEAYQNLLDIELSDLEEEENEHGLLKVQAGGTQGID